MDAHTLTRDAQTASAMACLARIQLDMARDRVAEAESPAEKAQHQQAIEYWTARIAEWKSAHDRATAALAAIKGRETMTTEPTFKGRPINEVASDRDNFGRLTPDARHAAAILHGPADDRNKDIPEPTAAPFVRTSF